MLFRRCKEIEKEFKKVIGYINKSMWKDDTEESLIAQIAQDYVNSLPESLKKEKLLHRVCGQSGSGKTTQLVKSLSKVYKKNNVEVCYIAVRTFSSLHPNYESLLKKYEKQHIREKTNGFALKCLIYALKLLFRAGFLIVLEITLLQKVFEKLILKLAKTNNYKVMFHMLAVSPSISNMLLEKRNRLANSQFETGRLTYKKSSSYFNKLLPKSFKFLARQNICEANIIIWNAFDIFPCYFGNIKLSKKIFVKNRKVKKPFAFSEKDLVEAKTEFYENNKAFIKLF